jgi:hypothetical protein
MKAPGNKKSRVKSFSARFKARPSQESQFSFVSVALHVRQHFSRSGRVSRRLQMSFLLLMIFKAEHLCSKSRDVLLVRDLFYQNSRSTQAHATQTDGHSADKSWLQLCFCVCLCRHVSVLVCIHATDTDRRCVSWCTYRE